MEIETVKEILLQQENFTGEIELKVQSLLRQTSPEPKQVDEEWRAICKVWEKFEANNKKLVDAGEAKGAYVEMKLYEKVKEKVLKAQAFAKKHSPATFTKTSASKTTKPGVPPAPPMPKFQFNPKSAAGGAGGNPVGASGGQEFGASGGKGAGASGGQEFGASGGKGAGASGGQEFGAAGGKGFGAAGGQGFTPEDSMFENPEFYGLNLLNQEHSIEEPKHNAFWDQNKDDRDEMRTKFYREIRQKFQHQVQPQPSPATGLDQQSLTMILQAVMKEQRVENEKLITTLASSFQQIPREPQSQSKGISIEVPIFNGDIKKFKAFEAIFVNVVNRSQVSNIEKLTLLRAKLSGEALKIVEHLQINDDNYEKTWDLLRKRFEDERAIIRSEIDALIDMKRTSPDDIESIKETADRLREIVYNLETLKVNIDGNGPLIAHHVVRKLDAKTRREFEKSLPDTVALPTVDQVLKFLDDTFQELRSVANSEMYDETQQKKTCQKKSQETRTHVTINEKSNNLYCLLCYQDHKTTRCPKLREAGDKQQLLRSHLICQHCASHPWNNQVGCRVKDHLRCDVCGYQHLTTLHSVRKLENQTNQITTNTNCYLSENQTDNSGSSTILPTAIIPFMSRDGEERKFRCLMDQCSQSCYITENAVQTLKLIKKNTDVQVTSVGGEVTGKIHKLVNLRMKVLDIVINIKALVVKKISSQSPTARNIEWLDKKEHLADPGFYKSAQVSILLGANVLHELYLPGVKNQNGYLLQNTKVGWVVSGPGESSSISKVTSTHVALSKMETELQECWELPIKEKSTKSTEIKDYCEKLYQTQHYRKEDGSYVVPIPWKQDKTALGGSYKKVLRQYLAQEQRMQKDPEHVKKFNDFMTEYVKLGHMKEVEPEDRCNDTGDVYYIPYFSIIRKDAVTTVLRNVFNLSAETENGVSMNDTIEPGRTFQTKLFKMITQNRKFKWIYLSDVVKMYRRVKLLKQDAVKIRFLWRPSKEKPNIAPENFKLGQIIGTYPDAKDLVHKVDIKTKSAVPTIVPLPLEEKAEYINQETSMTSIVNTPIPTVRRSQRLLSKTIPKVILGMMCLVMMMCPMNSEKLEALSPGIHIKSIQPVWIKSMNLKFSISTGVNITQDLSIIQEHTKDFEEICKSESIKNDSMLNSHCQQYLDVICEERNITKNIILSTVNEPRKTRSWTLAAKIVGKAIPYITAATTVGLGIEMINLEKEVKDLKHKMKKISLVLLNTTELEYRVLDEKLDEMIHHTNQIALMQQITNFAEDVQTMLSLTMEKYEQIETYIPEQELAKQLSTYNGSFITPPNLPIKEVFGINPHKLSMKNGEIIITFEIPLVRNETYTKYVLFSIPDEFGQITNFENNAPFIYIICDAKNASYFFDYSENLDTAIYDITIKKYLPTCSLSIIKNKSNNKCEKQKFNGKHRLVQVTQNHTLIYANQAISFNASCNNSTSTKITSATLIDTRECKVSNSNYTMEPVIQATALALTDLQHLNLSSINPVSNIKIIAPVKDIHEEINNLKMQLSQELDSLDGTTQSDWSYTIIGVSTIITLALFVLIVRCFCSPSKKKSTSGSNFTTPKEIDEMSLSIVIPKGMLVQHL